MSKTAAMGNLLHRSMSVDGLVLDGIRYNLVLVATELFPSGTQETWNWSHKPGVLDFMSCEIRSLRFPEPKH